MTILVTEPNVPEQDELENDAEDVTEPTKRKPLNPELRDLSAILRILDAMPEGSRRRSVSWLVSYYTEEK